MKATLGEALNPRWQADLPLLALIMSRLIESAADFRDAGRWGSSGPTEILVSHAGCTGCEGMPWRSSRSGVSTRREHADRLRMDITSALFDGERACIRWRDTYGIHPGAVFRFAAAEPYLADLDAAWAEFSGLHGYRLQKSINPCHRDVKVLCFPQLCIGARRIWLKCEATSAGELRRHGGGASRWCVADLLDERAPIWRWQRETFAEFLRRGVAFFQGARPRKPEAGR